jgi:hypothetical protein
VAVDRGGLRFNVGVEYDPSNAQRFRADVEAMRKDFAALKAEFQGGAAATASLRSGFTQLAQANQKAAAAQTQNARATKALAQAELAQAKAASAAAQAQVRKENASRAAAQALAAEQKLETELLRTERARAQTATASAQASAAKSRATAAAAAAMQSEIRIERELAQVEKARADLALTNARIASRARTTEAQSQRDAIALQRQQAALEAAEERTRQARIGTQARAAREADRLRKANAGANAELGRTDAAAKKATGSLSQFLFTFRRLIGVLALFQLARRAFTAFVDLVRGGLNFNKTIETARLSITGLILSLTDVVDEQGKVVKGAQAIAAAQAEAARQTEELRKDALLTTASFDELLTTFQTAVGPGVTAGLKLDEIRKLAVRVAQVAPLVGLLQNQLAEEIRSLTTGVIRPQTSRIATVFGITGADIQRAKEAGRLSEFLEERFRGIQVISGKISFTLEGIQNRLKSAFSVTAGEAATGLFEEIKLVLSDITDLLTDPKSLQPRPEVVATLRAIFDALQNIVRAGREAAREISLEGAQKAISALAFLIEKFGVALVGALVGGLEAITGLVLTIRKILDGLGLTNEAVLELVRGFTKFFLISKTVSIAIGTATSAIGSLSALLPGILTNATAIGKAFGGWATIILGTVTAATSVFNILEQERLKADDALQKAFIERAKTARFLREDAFKVSIQNFIGSLPAGIQRAIGAAEREFAKFQKRVETAQLSFRPRGREATNEEQDEIRRNLQRAAIAEEEFKSLAKRSSLVRAQALDEEVALQDARSALDLRRLELAQLIDNNRVERERLELRRKGLEESAPEDIAVLEEKITALKKKQVQEENALVAAVDAARQEEQAVAEAVRDALEARQDQLILARQQAAATFAEAAGEERVIRLKRLRANAAEIALEEARNELGILQQQLQALQANNAEARRRAERQVDETLPGSSARTRAAEELVGLIEAQAAAEADLNAQIADATFSLEQQRDIVSGGFFDGALEGLQQFAEAVPTVFEQGVQAAKAIVTAFASEVSDAIVDAFDPTNDSSLKERIGRFFQDIARLLLNQAITNIIASLIPKQIADAEAAALEVSAATSAAAIRTASATEAAAIEISAAQTAATIRAAGSVAGGLFRGGLVRGYADGGRVGLLGRHATAAHSHARGYAGGGGNFARPAGLDSRDNVPAWLAAGEFVQPIRAVHRAGLDFMEVLRSGNFDRNLLRAAAGLGPGRGILGRASPPRRGFAEGGSVTNRSGTGRQQDQQPVPAFLVTDEKFAESAWRGGKKGWLRMFRENGDEIDRAIRGGRRR